ncbi:helix-turn-helix-domain containing protein type [Stemphylium lycopersici]|uniref:Helix-turn-helix-domain containing protein type n=1 Tax=Stemphylium lycopersici TaxID=183478 RepID=A0A364N9R5_STELY|nr:helix-turn-helix-domain containing protein type [Stemphylium lycopersici]RAR04802.1 helix-turn-helix-domain containing protein type [Stemphylium lycopersici]RAR14088.1 helix-turn-helix-domain containing protein type [Stemphylium lycopersici]
MSTSYSFYDATIPVMRNISKSAISFLTAAKEEISKNSNLPSEKELLDAKIGDMLPFRAQPILIGNFQTVALESLKLSSAAAPAMNPSAFSSFDDLINFFKQVIAVFDGVDEKAYNESAKKSVDVPVAGKTLTMTALHDYTESFVIPNSYFHLNALYMLLRSKGFALGKTTYIAGFMSEQSQKDWAPLRG